jgi:hypothetical protein
MIKLIYDQAVAKLSNQKDNLDQLIKETTGSEIGNFIQRVLSWYHDETKKQFLWEIFNKVFDLSPVLFMIFRQGHPQPCAEGGIASPFCYLNNFFFYTKLPIFIGYITTYEVK